MSNLLPGHLERRGHVYWWRHWVERVDQATGEIRRTQVRERIGSFRSRRAAERALADYLAQAGAEELAPGPTVTLGKFAAGHDRSHVALQRRTSARAFRATLRCHVLPLLGGRLLHTIRPADLQELVATMHATGRARATIRSAVVRVIQLMHQARKDGYAVRPVTLRAVALPREQEARRARPFFDGEEIQRLLDASDARRRALWALGACGLRCGEILGTAWSDIDFEARTLHVERNAVGGRLGALKTAGSQRVLPLTPQLEAILRAYRAECGATSGLLFHTKHGKPLDGNYVRRHWWRPLLKRLGLRQCGLHALRHSAPRLLDRLGMSPEAIRQWCGHSNLQQTAAYLHLAGRDLRTQLDAALARSGEAKL